MKDRELLELAAKAAGVEYTDFCEFGLVIGQVHDNTCAGAFWDPLQDDGDALRLAVKLRMIVSLAECMCCAVVDWDGNDDDNEVCVRFSESFSDRECSSAEQATRLAITRAAAQIQLGKEKK